MQVTMFIIEQVFGFGLVFILDFLLWKLLNFMKVLVI